MIEPPGMGAKALIFWVCLAHGSSAQEEPTSYITLPEIPAYKLSGDQYFILRGRVSAQQADFIRRLRKVPTAESLGEPTSLIIEKYLKRPSKAFQSDHAYVESDWIPPEDLARMAALVPRAVLAVDELFGVPERHVMKSVLVKTKEDYLALTDAWAADEETIRRQARGFSGIWVKGHRDGYVTELGEAYALVMADAVKRHLPDYYREAVALSEGLHLFLTTMTIRDFQLYAAAETSSSNRSRTKVEILYEKARDVLADPKFEGLEPLFRSDLNGLSIDRLALSFCLSDFLLQMKREDWRRFLDALDRESHENGKLKGPEGRYFALVRVLEDVFGLTLKDLEKALREFTQKGYLYTEELARLVGVDKECAESAFEGFVTICRLKREGKQISDKGDRIYAEILRRLERKLGSQRGNF